MNSIVALLCASAIFAAVSASGGGYGGSSSSGGSYGGGAAMSIPAPPCPKNYLFSCQPNLAPAPCSPGAAAAAASAGGYGSSGAYSDNIPTVANGPYPGAPYQGYPNFQHQFPHFYGQVGSNNNN